MSRVFDLTPRELCNVVYALLTAGMANDQAAEFDALLENPRGREAVAVLRAMGVAS